MARILVTGASTGLDLLTATSLARAGNEVILHARTPERIKDDAILSLMHATIWGDLADPEETRRVAGHAGRHAPLEAVIHNAGVYEGSDLMAVNVVAPFVLTALMDPPGRVIVISSSMHRSGSPSHIAEKISGKRNIGYSDSKLFVTMFAMAVARRWPNVPVHAVDPGWVPTRMGARPPPDDLTEGHRTQGWLATVSVNTLRPPHRELLAPPPKPAAASGHPGPQVPGRTHPGPGGSHRNQFPARLIREKPGARASVSWKRVSGRPSGVSRRGEIMGNTYILRSSPPRRHHASNHHAGTGRRGRHRGGPSRDHRTHRRDNRACRRMHLRLGPVALPGV